MGEAEHLNTDALGRFSHGIVRILRRVFQGEIDVEGETESWVADVGEFSGRTA